MTTKTRNAHTKWGKGFHQAYALFGPARRDIQRMLPGTLADYGILGRLDALAEEVSAAFADVANRS